MLPIAGSCEKIGAIFKTIFRSPKGQRSVAPFLLETFTLYSLSISRRTSVLYFPFGSERAGPRVAAIVSIVEACRRLNIPVRHYLGSILPGLANFPVNRIAELTPTAWAARISRLVEFARPAAAQCAY